MKSLADIILLSPDATPGTAGASPPAPGATPGAPAGAAPSPSGAAPASGAAAPPAKKNENIINFLKRGGLVKDPVKPGAAPKDGDGTPTPPKSTTPPPAKPKAATKPKAPVRPVAPAQPAIDPSAIAQAVAEGVTKALPKPRDTTPATPELSPDAKRTVAVLDKMAELYPDKYKDISRKWVESSRKLKDYIANWKQAHPGEEFDEKAEEHDAFYESNDVDWEDEDFEEATFKVRLGKELEKEREKTGAKLTELERKEKLREAAPEIFSEQTVAARSFWKQLGEDFADVVAENGQVNMAKLQELNAKDPVIHALRLESAEALDRDVNLIYGIYNNLIPFDERNPAHQELENFGAAMERSFLAKAPEDQIDAQGRTFLPAEKYWKLSKTQREQMHWTLGVRDLAALRAAHLAQKAASRIAQEEEKYKAWAKARGLNVDQSPSDQRQPSTANGEDDADLTELKPHSPEAGVVPKTAARLNGKDAVPTSSRAAFFLRGLAKR